MSAKNALVGLGLSVGLGVGVGYAVHEVGELHREADRIEACLDYAVSSEKRSEVCDSVIAGTVEADGLRRTANTTGMLGWLAFSGTCFAVVGTFELIRPYCGRD